MNGSGRNGGGRVKVVVINTQYVETDAGSFKSVVQNLTGKDAPPPEAHPPPLRFQSSAAGGSYDAAPVLVRGMSFKDIEGMLKELPPLEELYRLYSG